MVLTGEILTPSQVASQNFSIFYHSLFGPEPFKFCGSCNKEPRAAHLWKLPAFCALSGAKAFNLFIYLFCKIQWVFCSWVAFLLDSCASLSLSTFIGNTQFVVPDNILAFYRPYSVGFHRYNFPCDCCQEPSTCSCTRRTPGSPQLSFPVWRRSR